MSPDPFEFDRAIACTDLGADTDPAAGPGADRGLRRAAAELDARWNVDGVRLNGGYLQAIATSAARQVVGGHADPVAVSTTFVAPPSPGAATVDILPLHRGRSVSKALATLTQGGAIVMQTLVTMGDVPAVPVAAPDLPFPDVPAAEACGADSITGPLPHPPGLMRLLDMAFVPETSGWLAGRPGNRPRIQVWLRFADGRPLDTMSLVALADMAPPVCFALGMFGWAPTLQMQVAVCARPTGDWLLLDLLGSPYGGAFVVEDCDMWDGTGQLVARSRQIAIPPRP